MLTTKQVMVVAGITSAIAFCSYKVYKAYKIVKEEMALEDKRTEVQEELEVVGELFEELEEKRSNIVLFDDESYSDYDKDKVKYTDMFGGDEPDSEEEEEEVLRWPPSSPEARKQYYDIKLADIHDPALVSFLIQFEHETFIPTCDEDEILRDRIRDDKAEFFGEESCWSGHDFVSILDLFIHYGYMADFDLSGGIEKWLAFFANQFKINAGVLQPTSESIRALLDHTLAGTGAQGIFGCVVDLSKPTSFNREYWEFLEANS